MSKSIIDLLALKKFRQEYDKRLKEGKIVPLLSEELTPVSKQSGSTQETPFINQGTATNNNDSQAEVDTGPTGEHLQKQGNVANVNQLMSWGNNIAGTYDNGAVVVSIENGKIKIVVNGTRTNQVTIGFNSINKLSNNTYIYAFNESSNLTPFIGYNEGKGVRIGFSVPSGHVMGSSYGKSTSSSYGVSTVVLYIGTNLTDGTYYIKPVYKNATQWFNGDIPQDLLDHPSHFSWYYNGSLDYNAGQLVASNGRYLECGQSRNIYNPEETYNGVIPNRKYHYYKSGGSATTITYYDKDKNAIDTESVSNDSDFTTPANCWFINSSVASPTISLWYATENNYSQEYPYVAPKRYDTGTETLYKAGSVKDYKTPDGTIHRLVGIVDLGAENMSWSYQSGNKRFVSQSIASLVKHSPNDNEYVANVSCSLYIKGTVNATADTNMVIAIDTRGYIYVKNTSYTTGASFKTAMSGVYLYYEKAQESAEQGTPFDENIEINDMSYMAWYDTDGNIVSIPQGCKLFYPAWIKGFVDSVGQREDIDWSADKIVSQEQMSALVGALSSLNTPITTSIVNAINSLLKSMQDNVGGALRHQLSSANSLDFANTDYKDLGSLNWTRFNTGVGYYVFSADISNIKTSSQSKIICSIYKSGTAWGSLNNKECSARASYNTLYIRDDTYTDATAFKNAMKGILLAYEKAS